MGSWNWAMMVPMRFLLALASAVLALAPCPARAQDLHVMTSGGYTATLLEVTPRFERATGVKVHTVFGASLGGAPDSIPARLARREPADVVIVASAALDDLARQGLAAPGSRVDLVRSPIGMVVRAGAPKPDIGTVESLTRALRAARSVAYSASASGVYLSMELFPRLGLADEMRQKGRRIESERVAAVVARGDAELGFQQVSELLPVAGVDYVGPLPDGAQRITVFSAGIGARAATLPQARAFIAFLQSAEVAAVATKSGLDPIPAPAPAARPAR
jgi:molybdate transport system substrate-binding protein